MALDTIVIKSPYLSEQQANLIEAECIKRQAIDIKSGELIYCITTGDLDGSYDSRIKVKVERQEWKCVWVPSAVGRGSSKSIKSACEPYVVIEGSVHKAMLGHNVYGGPEGLHWCVKWLISLVSDLIGVSMPDWGLWYLKRADVAEVYRLSSFDACSEWFRGLNACEYPRRKVNRYGVHGLYCATRNSAIKFYHKGPDFIKHDRPRLKKFLDADKLLGLQTLANDIIRVEVEVKLPKMEYDFNHAPLVKEVSDEYLYSVFDREVAMLLKEGNADMITVRQSSAVQSRLFGMYSSSAAGLYLGTWYKLSAVGESEVKKTMSKSAFYRHRKALVDAGVSWNGTDVMLKDFYLVPKDFSPVRTDSRRYVVELPEVVAIRERFSA